jgi:hypothetical protein
VPVRPIVASATQPANQIVRVVIRSSPGILIVPTAGFCAIVREDLPLIQPQIAAAQGSVH